MKVLPIGVGTCGNGSNGPLSIGTVTKDYRARIELGFDAAGYNLKDVVGGFAAFVNDEVAVPRLQRV